MSFISDLKTQVLNGYRLNAEEAMQLTSEPLAELTAAADELRRHFCGEAFDICTIVNAKSGRCSEDCKFCAQSSFYNTTAQEYPLLSTSELTEQAKYNDERGVLRYSLVTSGKKVSAGEVEKLCRSIEDIRRNTDIAVCVSLGLLDEVQFGKLAQAGAVRVHNNLETSARNFPNICSTHTYDEKIAAIKAAQQAGLSICSGGIMGLGETYADRIDMVLTLRELGVRSIPVNMLNPIPGTPFADNPLLTNDDMCRIVAIFRFLIPDAFIRLAGGRGILPDKGRRCFLSGANAAISGDMLTTSGTTIESDLQMIAELGYKAVRSND